MTYWFTAAVLLTYLTVAWFMGTWLHLQSPQLWILRGGLAAIGIVGAALFLWFHRRAEHSTESTEPDSADDDLESLIREADIHLRSSRLGRGANLRNLPLIFLVGDQGATKTTTVLRSGIEAELLAGQTMQNDAVAPTKLANLWFAKGTVLVEVARSLLSDASRWKRLVKRLQPGKRGQTSKIAQAPRAAVVFYNCENFLRSGAAEYAAASARDLRSRLRDVSESLGINFPVYVLFTKVDRVPFFGEYVRNLTRDEARQVFGITLPLKTKASSTVYEEAENTRLSTEFDGLFYSLCDHRAEFLNREHSEDKLSGIYEFPREFRKVRSMLVEFLVELARPSQLRSAPFLRGFYFSGVRAVVINDALPVAVGQTATPEAPFEASRGATRLFQFRGGSPATELPQPAAQAPRAGTARKVPEWVFTDRLFNDVILRDRAALATSAVSGKVSYWRRAALASAVVLLLLLCTAFGVSYYYNRQLEDEVISAARQLPSDAVVPINAVSKDQLLRLDGLRNSLQKLATYDREGPPWYMRWGLYSGDRLYVPARTLYFRRFNGMMFAETQTRLLEALRRLPATPGPGDDRATAYADLKAYLITTSNHDKSTRMFLPDVLMRHWAAGRDVSPDVSQLARKQFDFYAEELKLANPFSTENDAYTVDRARAYLAKFGGIEQIYSAIVAAAAKATGPIIFNQMFPGSENVLVVSKNVEGAYTKRGWDFVQSAIQQHLGDYYHGEQWVLGDQAAAVIGDEAGVQNQLRTRYASDYAAQWRELLKSAKVVQYNGIKDAATKLQTLAGNQSPILELLWTVSQNTSVDPQLAAIFKPAQTVVPPTQTDRIERYTGPTNESYMNALGALQASLDAISDPTVDKELVERSISAATNADGAAGNIARNFSIDNEGHVETTVENILRQPIESVTGMLRESSAGALNKQGAEFCTAFHSLSTRFPFNPRAQDQVSIQQLNEIFAPQGGKLWSMYDTTLRNYVVRDGSQFKANPSGGVRVNPAFIAFLNKAGLVTSLLYGQSSQQPNLTFTMRARATEELEGVKLNINGEQFEPTTASEGKQFHWPGTGTDNATLSAILRGGSEVEMQRFDGSWAVFKLIAAADRKHASSNAVALDWVAKSGASGQSMSVNGHPVTVHSDLSAGTYTPAFAPGFFSDLRCVPTIAAK